MVEDPTAAERRTALTALQEEVRRCPRCAEPFAGRTTVVFGEGAPDAGLFFVGEAPRRNEDRQGLPLVGAPARLLNDLLAEVGIERRDTYAATVLKHRPPDNRDPLPEEVEHGLSHLHAQIALVAPRVVCPLGAFATKLLRGSSEGIRDVHGRVEVLTVGTRTVRVLPLFDPAAALYRREIVEELRRDVARLPALLALGPPEPLIVEPSEVEGDAEAGTADSGPVPGDPGSGVPLDLGDEPDGPDGVPPPSTDGQLDLFT